MAISLSTEENDKAAARQFLDGCYDDTVPRLNKVRLERLIELGWIERVKGGYAETRKLRSINLY